MTVTGRAMVFDGPGAPLELRRYPLPELREGEVLVKVTCCTLCGSDLHTFAGHRSTPCPTVLGHEILGTMAALPTAGPVVDFAGRPLEVGDRITWSVTASCGACFFCRRDIPQKCQRLFKYGHQRLTAQHPFSGGLADYCHLAPGTAILRVPDQLSDAVATPAGCATATVAAALRVAGELRDTVLLIQGAGMLGLTAAAMARNAGAAEIIVCDVNSDRLARAGAFGASHCVNITTGLSVLEEAVADTTEGRGVDVALELCGAPAAMEAAPELLRIGGTYVVVGAVFPSRPVALSAETIVRKLLTIRGVHNYKPEDLAAAVAFLARTAGNYPFDRLVAPPVPLAQANAAFQAAETGGALRVAVVP